MDIRLVPGFSRGRTSIVTPETPSSFGPVPSVCAGTHSLLRL